MKRMSTLFFVLLLVNFAFAQNQVQKHASVYADESQVVSTRPAGLHLQGATSSKAANWKFVDTMANALGTAIHSLNPLAFDPYANIGAFFHRSMASLNGSGALFYNVTTDAGTTWRRVAGPVNAGTQPGTLRGRYPSMTISNPTKSASLADITAAFAWPALDNAGAGFDLQGYAADQPIGTGAAFAAVIDHNGTYSSQSPIWAADGNAYVYWTAEYGTPVTLDQQARFFRTNDFSTIDSSFANGFLQDSVTFAGFIILGGASKGANTYMGALGSFTNPDSTAAFIKSGWYPAINKSTDNGKTWSGFEICDFRKIPALSKFDRLHDYKKGDAYVSYCGDINVDKDGYPHLVTVLTDTTLVDPTGANQGNSGTNAVVELYKTAAGWTGKIVFEGISDSGFTKFSGVDPGLGQCGPMPMLAVDKSGQYFACQWVNPTSKTDSIADIWISTRTSTGNWTTPVNLTGTTGKNENCAHLAPMLGGVAPNFTAYSGYSYERGNTGYTINTSNAAEFYAAAVPLVISATDKNGAVINTFELEQNYPNPFNPTTNIRFSLSQKENVTLRVFDVLGREVATLVNGNMESGVHAVEFNGTNLASGMYMYKLEAGNQVEIKKMMLMK